MAKLENFIEQYLKNKKISDYDGWLAAYGKDSEGEYAAAKAEADTSYAKSKATYGQNAASLYARGLSGSGYSDHLDAAAYAEHIRMKEAALKQKSKTEKENRSGYLSYLSAEAEKAEAQKSEKEKQLTDIFNDLLGKKISDKSAAVTYLKMRGIDEESANTLADQSIQILRGGNAYRNDIIRTAISNEYYYPQAYQYALLQGITPAMADEIAKLVSFAVTNNYNSYDFYKPTY